MTNEQAKSELMQIYMSLSEEKKQALDVLVAQADGEYISRTELLKALESWDRFGVDDTNSLFRLDNLSLPHYVAYIHYDDVVKCIKALPSVAIPSAEPKTGHWEMCEDADGIYGVCDICGTDADFTHYGKAYPYCPNCGARMFEPTCDTCEYTTAAFNPCNACKDKSEYKPQERSEVNNGQTNK